MSTNTEAMARQLANTVASRARPWSPAELAQALQMSRLGVRMTIMKAWHMQLVQVCTIERGVVVYCQPSGEAA